MNQYSVTLSLYGNTYTVYANADSDYGAVAKAREAVNDKLNIAHIVDVHIV